MASLIRYDLEDTSGKLALEAALAGKLPALANQRDDLQSRLDEAQSLSIAARREAADLREELGRIRRALEHERARSAGLEAQLQTKTELLDAESQRGSEVQQKLIETIKDRDASFLALASVHSPPLSPPSPVFTLAQELHRERETHPIPAQVTNH